MSISPSHVAPPSSSTCRSGQTYDVFISHAGPDKDTIAKPLHEKLEKLNISTFVDEKAMRPGCQAPPAMMEAVNTAAIGVFILSADFVARKWPVKELYCFLERVEKAASQGGEMPVLIPVFYRLSTEQCHRIELLLGLYEGGRSPFIEGRFIQRQRKGEPEADLDKVQAALTSLVTHMGIRNPNGVTNDNSNDTMENRGNVIAEVNLRNRRSVFTSLVSYFGSRNLKNVTNDNSSDTEKKRERLVDEVVKGVVEALKEKSGVKETSSHAPHSAADGAAETMDSFQARFDVPIPLPNIVLLGLLGLELQLRRAVDHNGRGVKEGAKWTLSRIVKRLWWRQ